MHRLVLLSDLGFWFFTSRAQRDDSWLRHTLLNAWECVWERLCVAVCISTDIHSSCVCVYFQSVDVGIVMLWVCVFCTTVCVYSSALTINEILKCLWCIKWQLAAVVTLCVCVWMCCICLWVFVWKWVYPVLSDARLLLTTHYTKNWSRGNTGFCQPAERG